jgi:two-component sensor histidine kinase
MNLLLIAKPWKIYRLRTSHLLRNYLCSILWMLSVLLGANLGVNAQDKSNPIEQIIQIRTKNQQIISLDKYPDKPKMAKTALVKRIEFIDHRVDIYAQDASQFLENLRPENRHSHAKYRIKIYDMDGYDITPKPKNNKPINERFEIPEISQKDTLEWVFGKEFKPKEAVNLHFVDLKTDSILHVVRLIRLDLYPLPEKYVFSRDNKVEYIENSPNRWIRPRNGQDVEIEVKQPFGIYKNIPIHYSLRNIHADVAQHFETTGNIKITGIEPNSQIELYYWYEGFNTKTTGNKAYIMPYDPNFLPAEANGNLWLWFRITWNKFPGVIIGAVLFLLIIGIIAFFEYRKYHVNIKYSNRRNAEKEQQLSRIYAQLNPHFVFNALNSIQSLMNSERKDEANTYLNRFSDLLRKTLENSQQKWIHVMEEWQLMETYLQLEQLRFGFHYEIQVDLQGKENEIQIPTMLIQPLLENAIKHGIGEKGSKGHLNIQLKLIQSDLHITIHDNGKGFDPYASPNGFGIKLTKERIKLLNELHPNCPIEIYWNMHTGCEVKLHFKNCID